MTAAGPSTGRSSAATPGSPCDNCHLVDDTMTLLREETERRGFPTADGVHMGPCEVYRRHSHTIGPDGSLYACPGFTGEFALAVGHIDGRREPESRRRRAPLRAPRAVAPLRRLSVHSGLRRRLRGCRPCRAWRHGCAVMSQAES